MCEPSHILLDCLSHISPAAKAARIASTPDSVWPSVASLARELNVSSLLYHNLKPSGTPFRHPIVETLREDYLKQAWRASLMYRDVSRFLHLAHQHDIPVILLKGVYLADAVYDNIALRAMGDVDLLVQRKHLAALEQRLAAWDPHATHAKGHSSEHEFHIAYTLNSGLRIEIHWGLHPPRQKYRIDLDEIWGRAVPTTIAGAPAMAMTREDLLLHQCLHISRNPREMHLRMLCDIGMLTRPDATRLDWQALTDRARRWGLSRALYLWLRLARKALRAQVPDHALAGLQPVAFDERFLDLALRKMLCHSTALQKMESISKLQNQKGAIGKLTLLRRRLFLPRHEMARIYKLPAGSWRVYPCYGVRMKHLLQRYGGIGWRLARAEIQTVDAVTQPDRLDALGEWILSESSHA